MDRRDRASDLEGRSQAETARRRLGDVGRDPIFDFTVDVAAPASATWAHLTSPALRPGWEGPIRIEETAPDGRRGVGTTTRCVTGVLASLEEIVDWQPFEHAGYRMTVPHLGPIEATYDLGERSDRQATTIRHRWVPAGEPSIDVETRRRLERERLAAFERLRLNLAATSGDKERLLEPFIRGEVSRGEAKEVERLKALLEGNSTTTESVLGPA